MSSSTTNATAVDSALNIIEDIIVLWNSERRPRTAEAIRWSSKFSNVVARNMVLRAIQDQLKGDTELVGKCAQGSVVFRAYVKQQFLDVIAAFCERYSTPPGDNSSSSDSGSSRSNVRTDSPAFVFDMSPPASPRR